MKAELQPVKSPCRSAENTAADRLVLPAFDPFPEKALSAVPCLGCGGSELRLDVGMKACLGMMLTQPSRSERGARYIRSHQSNEIPSSRDHNLPFFACAKTEVLRTTESLC